MSTQEVLAEALKLKPEERFLVVEGLLQSLDEPDEALSRVWLEEAERRLNAYRNGRLAVIPMEELFKDE